MIRDVYVQAALGSVRKLREILPQLSPDEIARCLQLECETQRRVSLLDVLAAQLVELNRQTFVTTLKEKYTCLAKLPL
jgi:hypothetical protein